MAADAGSLRGPAHGHWVIDDRDGEDGGTGATLGAVASTTVHFAAISDDEIQAYVATGEPLKVAGAFTLDGLGAPYVEGIEGDPSNVVGISLPLMRELLGSLASRRRHYAADPRARARARRAPAPRPATVAILQGCGSRRPWLCFCGSCLTPTAVQPGTTRPAPLDAAARPRAGGGLRRDGLLQARSPTAARRRARMDAA